MSEQPKSDDTKEPLITEQESSDKTSSIELSPSEPHEVEVAATSLPSQVHETEWIPGEHLELIRIPQPTVWPVTLGLGVTGIAFGVVTHWILSLAGLFLFLLGAAGWIEDLRKDVLQ